MAKPKFGKRMRDVIAYRITDEQRASIERYAEDHKVGVCEAARMLLVAGIQATGLV